MDLQSTFFLLAGNQLEELASKISVHGMLPEKKILKKILLQGVVTIPEYKFYNRYKNIKIR